MIKIIPRSNVRGDQRRTLQGSRDNTNQFGTQDRRNNTETGHTTPHPTTEGDPGWKAGSILAIEGNQLSAFLLWIKWVLRSPSWWPHRQGPLFSLWNSPDQNAGVGILSLLQGIFPTQGSNSDLLHCRCILYQLDHQGSPRMLEWEAYPFSRGSSWPRNPAGSPALQADSLPTEPWGKSP